MTTAEQPWNEPLTVPLELETEHEKLKRFAINVAVDYYRARQDWSDAINAPGGASPDAHFSWHAREHTCSNKEKDMWRQFEHNIKCLIAFEESTQEEKSNEH